MADGADGDQVGVVIISLLAEQQRVRELLSQSRELLKQMQAD